MAIEQESALVGRDEERALVSRLLAGGGRPTTLVEIVGPPGIGKTALLHALRRDARQRGADRLWLDTAVVRAAPDLLARDLAGFAQARAASYGPALVCLDNYDQAGVLDGWIRELAANCLQSINLVVAVATRRGLPPAWRADPGWAPRIVRLSPPPLSPPQVARLLERRRSGPQPDADQVVRLTGGLPAAVARLATEPPDAADRALAALAPVLAFDGAAADPEGYVLLEALAVLGAGDPDLLRAAAGPALAAPDAVRRLERLSACVEVRAGVLAVAPALRVLFMRAAEVERPGSVSLWRQRALAHLAARLGVDGEGRGESLARAVRLIADSAPAVPAISLEEPAADLWLDAGPRSDREWRRAVRWLRSGRSHDSALPGADRADAILVLRDGRDRMVGAAAVLDLESPGGRAMAEDEALAPLDDGRGAAALVLAWAAAGRRTDRPWRDLAGALLLKSLPALGRFRRVLVRVDPVAAPFLEALGWEAVGRLPGDAQALFAVSLDGRGWARPAGARGTGGALPGPDARARERMVREALASRDDPVALGASHLARALRLDGISLRDRLRAVTALIGARSEETGSLLRELGRGRAGRASAVASRLHVSRATYYRQVSRVCLEIFAELEG